MESSKRRTPKRKPLSECTNTISSHNSTKPLLLNPSKFLPSSTFTVPHDNDNPNLNNVPLISKSDTSVGSNNHFNTSQDDDVSPIETPSIPCPPFRVRVVSPTTTSVECRTVYTRRRAAAENRKEKGKIVVERNINFREVANGGDIVGLSKSCVISRQKKPHQLPSKNEEIVLLNDYIDQQRAYFAEIDAFELEEEVASESELD